MTSNDKPRPPRLVVKKVLVPTDFSEESKKALRYGLELARASGAELLLAHVVEFLVYPVGPVMLPAQEQDLRDRLGTALEDLRHKEVPAQTTSRALKLRPSFRARTL